MNKNSAYLLVTCDVGKLEEVISRIENLDSIKEIHGTFGPYDIVAKIESTTFNHLQKFIVQKIRTLIDVRSVITLHCKPNLEYSVGRKRTFSTIETPVTAVNKMVTIQDTGKLHGI